MVILIVANNANLAGIWASHLERRGHRAMAVASQHEAISFLQDNQVGVIVLDLLLEDGSPIAVADYASYRWPKSKIIFVTKRSFFSDGSIFNHIPNAAAIVENATPPRDLAAIVEYHGRGFSGG